MYVMTWLLSMAWASEAPALDYAAPEGCPDAGRFADEVSARLGRLAFALDGQPLTVRIADTGTEQLGTLEYAGGTKLVRSASCQGAFDDLVASAAVLLEPELASASASASLVGSQPQPEKVRVSVALSDEGAEPRHDVLVARIVGRGVGSGAGVTVVSTYYEDICAVPCSFEIEPGFHEFSTYGKGLAPASDKFDVRGQELSLLYTPKPAAVVGGGITLASLGLSSVLVGAPLLAVGLGSSEPEISGPLTTAGGITTIAGVAMTGLSIPLLRRSKLEER